MDKTWKVVFAFVLVFMAGAIFGGVFTLGFSVRRTVAAPKAPQPKAAVQQPTGQPRPPGAPAPQAQPVAKAATPTTNPITPTLMRQFTQRLGLSAEQRERIRPIVTRAGEDLVRLRQENLADTARVTERMYVDVAAVLTPEQKKELEAMQRQIQERVEAEKKKRQEAAAAAEAAAKNAAAQKSATAAPPQKR